MFDEFLLISCEVWSLIQPLTGIHWDVTTSAPCFETLCLAPVLKITIPVICHQSYFRNISIIIPKPLLAHSSSQYSVTWVMWTLLNPYAQDMKIYGIYLDLTSSEPPWINVIDSGLSWVSCQMLGFLQRPKVSSKLYQGCRPLTFTFLCLSDFFKSGQLSYVLLP